MQEIKLTINGTREIPIEVSNELLERLKDSNEDIRLLITASLTEAGSRPSHGEEPATEIIRLKLIALEIQ